MIRVCTICGGAALFLCVVRGGYNELPWFDMSLASLSKFMIFSLLPNYKGICAVTVPWAVEWRSSEIRPVLWSSMFYLLLARNLKDVALAAEEEWNLFQEYKSQRGGGYGGAASASISQSYSFFCSNSMFQSMKLLAALACVFGSGSHISGESLGVAWLEVIDSLCL